MQDKVQWVRGFRWVDFGLGNVAVLSFFRELWNWTNLIGWNSQKTNVWKQMSSEISPTISDSSLGH